MSKFVGTGPSSYKKKRIYRAAVSQMLRNTTLNSLCETQSQSGRFGEDINLLLLPGIERRFLGCSVRSVVTVPSELSLHISMKNNALFIFILSCSAKLYRGRIQRTSIILAPNFNGTPTAKIVPAVRYRR